MDDVLIILLIVYGGFFLVGLFFGFKARSLIILVLGGIIDSVLYGMSGVSNSVINWILRTVVGMIVLNSFINSEFK